MAKNSTFWIAVELENPRKPGPRRPVKTVLVGTGVDTCCFPGPILESLGIFRKEQRKYIQPDGTISERWVGECCVHVKDRSATEDVVFCEAGDLTVIGLKALRAMNLRPDPANERLVDDEPDPTPLTARRVLGRLTLRPA